MDEESVTYLDVLAQRLNAFASLATTLTEIEDPEIRALGVQMLQRTIESCTLPKAPVASLSVVKS